MRIPKIKDPQQVSASFTPAVIAFIDAEAERQDVPRAAIIRGLVSAGIQSIYGSQEEKDGNGNDHV